MAITQNPITGTMRKTAGGMVFSRSLDQNVMRAKPITYNDRKSDAQIKQRVRMKACHGLSKADSKKALDAAFPTRPTKQTKFSAFVQAIIKVIIGGLAGVTYEWDKLPLFGNGSLKSGMRLTSFEFAGTSITIDWDEEIDNTQSTSNQTVYAFLFNTTKGAGYSLTSAVKVSDKTWIFSAPSGWLSTDNIEIYLGSTSAALYDSSPAFRIT